MSTGDFVTPQEFSDFQGGTGQYSLAAVTNALSLAEQKVEDWLLTDLAPTEHVEEMPWSNTGVYLLPWKKIISIDAVTALHNVDCSCNWMETTGCAVVLEASTSVVSLLNCQGLPCFPCRCPKRWRVTYTAGYTPQELASNHKIAGMIKAAIYTATVGFLQTTIGLDAQGNSVASNWSSAGYSESRQYNERSGSNELVNPMIQQAKELLRGLTKKRAIGIGVGKGHP